MDPAAIPGDPMTFNTAHNHHIAPAKGKEMISAFQLGQPEGTIFGHAFNKKALLNLLSQPGAEGIRFYHALNTEGEQTLVALAVRDDGSTIDDDAIDESFPCPPMCIIDPTVPEPKN